MTDTVIAEAVRWIFDQPATRFSIDAKVLLSALPLVGAGTREHVLADKLRLVRAARLSEGGFRSKYGGGDGSVVATADAVSYLALHGDPADAMAIARSLDWLRRRQLADGSFLEVRSVPFGRHWYRAANGHVWITAALLHSIQAAVPCLGQEWATVTTRAWDFLDKTLTQFTVLTRAGAREDVLATFGYDRFSLAVAVGTCHDSGRRFPARELLERLSRGQRADGSFQGSADITQATGHALLRLTGSPLLPELAAAERYLRGCHRSGAGWAHGPGQRTDWTLTAYTVRLLIGLAEARNQLVTT